MRWFYRVNANELRAHWRNMGHIKHVFLYEDGALIVCSTEKEPLFGRYVSNRAELLLELAKVETDRSDALKVSEVERKVFIDKRCFTKSSSDKVIELDQYETAYFVRRQKDFLDFVESRSLKPVLPTEETKLIEMSAFGGRLSYGLALGGISPNGGHWIALVLSVEAATEILAATGINPALHINALRQHQKEGLSVRAPMAETICFVGGIAYMVNHVSAHLSRLRTN